MLRSKLFSLEQIQAILTNFRHAGLEPAEVAMMAFAEKITLHAYEVTPKDIEELRAHGFSDLEILDIAAVASSRNFFSKLVDAVGAEPDDAYQQLEPQLREVLAVGRPFGESRRPAGD